MGEILPKHLLLIRHGESEGDVLWAAHIPVDRVSLGQIESIDTDSLHNGHVVHYTNVNPASGAPEASDFQWKHSFTPWMENSQGSEKEWSRLEEPESSL